jgi:hypothetical protein
MNATWGDHNGPHNMDPYYMTDEEEKRVIELDQNEQREAAAERWISEKVVGDNFTCDCGQLCPLEDGHVISMDPYAHPVCPACAADSWVANP